MPRGSRAPLQAFCTYIPKLLICKFLQDIAAGSRENVLKSMAKAATQLAYSCDLKGPEGGGGLGTEFILLLAPCPIILQPSLSTTPRSPWSEDLGLALAKECRCPGSTSPTITSHSSLAGPGKFVKPLLRPKGGAFANRALSHRDWVRPG